MSRQANIWVEVVKDPKDFVSAIDMTSQSEFGKSLQFLCFVIGSCFILETPLDALLFHYHVFDATTQIIRLILTVMEFLLFCSGVYVFGRALRGKGRYRETLIAMFYSAALSPFVVPAQYFLVSGGGSPDEPKITAHQLIAAILIVAVLIYVTVKLIPVIKFAHSFGAIRALLVLGLVAMTDVIYGNLISGPLLAQLSDAK